MSESGVPVHTPRYDRVLGASEEVARRMSHDYVGVEHLFLAMIHDHSAIPAQALGKMVDLDAAESALLALMDSDGYKSGSTQVHRPDENG